MLYPIIKGDLLTYNGRQCIAASNDYTKLIYSEEDREMMRRWRDYEGGTATGVVNLLFQETGELITAVVIDPKKMQKVATLG